ncbi:MAG: TolC family outer membrane protein [Lysobacteraceae bacterium]
MTLRPLAFALAAAFGLAATAGATDLMDAYELARVNDTQVSVADSQRLAQRELVPQGRAALLPQVSGDAGITRSRTDSDGEEIFGDQVFPIDRRTEVTNRRYGVNVQQSVFDQGNYTRLRANRSRAEAAEADYEAAAQALLVRVSEAYFDVLTAIQQVSSSRAQERAVKRQLDQAEVRLEVGLAPITDVFEAQAQFDSSRANSIAAENALDDAREALAEITGRPLHGLRGLSADFQPRMDEAGLESWVELALEQNPLLRSRTLALQAAESDIASARSAHLPTLSASGGWNKNSSWGDATARSALGEETFPIGSASDGYSVGLTLSVPLFTGGLTQSRVRQQVFTRDAVADQLEAERRSITRQTRGAWRSLAAGVSEVEARRQAVVSAQSALDATEAGFEVGTRTIVDTLIAQQQLFGAEVEYARARHAFLVNGLRLRQAAGTLDVPDLQAVNRLLVTDAEAALEAGVSDPTTDP